MALLLSLLTAAATGCTKFINPTTLTASSGDAGKDRILTGLVLPFNKVGRTSLGDLSVTAGAVELPDDLRRVKLYRDHSDVGGTPVGYATGYDIKEDGLYMSFRVGATSDGDAALTDVAEGIRDALSVELVGAATSNGEITAASLSAVALVAVPAFEDARLALDDPASQPVPKAPALPSTASQVATGVVTASSRSTNLTLEGAATAMRAWMSGSRSPDVTAAIQKITESTGTSAMNHHWLGELWAGKNYVQRFIDTVATQALIGGKLVGWRWTTRPEVADYTGNLTEIASNAVAVEHVEVDAKRIAGGHKLDRKYRDFGDVAFLESYLRQLTESYAIKEDAHCEKFIIDECMKVKNEQNKQKNILRAAARANRLVKKAINQSPTTFIVNGNDLENLLDITKDMEPAYLKLLGISPEQFIDSDTLAKGHVVAYEKNAFLFGRLPNTPIRVSAEDVFHGGTDEAMFGYWAALVRDQRGLACVNFGA